MRLRAGSLAALLLVIASCGDAPDAGRALDLATLAAPGPHAVAERTLALVDRSRPTQASGSFPGAPERTLPTRVWYPAAAAGSADPASDGPFPIVGWAHGYASANFEGQFVGSHLASHGYVVVGPTFPATSTMAQSRCAAGNSSSRSPRATAGWRPPRRGPQARTGRRPFVPHRARRLDARHARALPTLSVAGDAERGRMHVRRTNGSPRAPRINDHDRPRRAGSGLKHYVVLDKDEQVNYSPIKMRDRQLELALRMRPRWGGARRGAGRKRARGRRASVPHRARPSLDARHPALVTLRACSGVTWLRSRPVHAALVAALSRASRADFRVVHYSVQTNHLHLIVEAEDETALSRGMRGLAIRCALAVNRALARRGALWADRYHASALRTPRMVRNALVYVLANARKHLRVAAGIDPCSSARWFDGFRDTRPACRDDVPTKPPRTWLLRIGWRRHGLLSRDEGPASSGPPRALRMP